MRNVLALLLLTAAAATSAADPPAPARSAGHPPGGPVAPPPAAKPAANRPAAAASCSSGASGAAYAATGKASSGACTFDAGITHVHGDPHQDQKGKRAPSGPPVGATANGASQSQPRTDAVVAPAQGRDKPPARP